MHGHRTGIRQAGALLALWIGLGAGSAQAAVPLIPRTVLFGPPVKTSPQLSPDGKRLAWLAPDARGVLQVWTDVPPGVPKPVTRDAKRGIRRFIWGPNARTLFYFQDREGD